VPISPDAAGSALNEMDARLKSILVSLLIQGALAYFLIMGLAMTFERQESERLATVDVTLKPLPGPPPAPPKHPPLRRPPVNALPPIT
jgi:hypothetical protein